MRNTSIAALPAEISAKMTRYFLVATEADLWHCLRKQHHPLLDRESGACTGMLVAHRHVRAGENS